MNNNPLFGKINNNQGVADILNNNSQYDLIDIMCNNVLAQIKKEINIPLDKKEELAMDEEFKKSLAPIIAANIANNVQLSNEYIKELSYIYFALLNKTIEIYYELKSKNSEIRYYMLDKQFYDSLAPNEIEWEKYKKLYDTVFDMAYKNGVLNEIILIYNANPEYTFYHGYESLLDKSFLNEIIDFYGINIVANSNLHCLKIGLYEGNIEYTKQLIQINPNISFEDIIIFDTKVRENFSINEIVNFTSNNLHNINKMIRDSSNEQLVEKFITYKKILEINPNFYFAFYNFMDLVNSKKFDMPLEVIADLSFDEQNKMGKLYTYTDKSSHIYYGDSSLCEAWYKTNRVVDSKKKLKKMIKKEIKKTKQNNM